MAHKNNDDEENEGSDSTQEDPVLRAKREIALSQIYKKAIIKDAGLVEDEIDTLLPDFAKLEQFYKEMIEMRANSSDDSHLTLPDDREEPSDAKDSLTPDEERRARELAGTKRQKKTKKAASPTAAQTDAFSKAGAHLAPEDQTSEEDLKKLLAELDDDEDDED